jgi:nitrous oxide reductase accessory protein NosL
MFVAPYPTWVARLRWSDGTQRFFDGPKDMFLALANPEKHLPGLPAIGLESAVVTEYYDLKLVPAPEAHFVVGSDVLGPMGKELVPLADAEAAADFKGDHGGSRILRASEVDAAVLGELTR